MRGYKGICEGIDSCLGEGNGTPLQYSCLENPMDREAWWTAVHGSLRVRHDWATSLSHIGEGNGNPLQCSCLENPRDGGAWWAAVYGVAQSRTRLKRLSSSSSRFVSWLWGWPHKSAYAVKLHRTMCTHITNKCMQNWWKLVIGLYQCHFPGCDTVLFFYKMFLLWESRWRVNKNLSVLFLTTAYEYAVISKSV